MSPLWHHSDPEGLIVLTEGLLKVGGRSQESPYLLKTRANVFNVS